MLKIFFLSRAMFFWQHICSVHVWKTVKMLSFPFFLMWGIKCRDRWVRCCTVDLSYKFAEGRNAFILSFIFTTVISPKSWESHLRNVLICANEESPEKKTLQRYEWVWHESHVKWATPKMNLNHYSTSLRHILSKQKGRKLSQWKSHNPFKINS